MTKIEQYSEKWGIPLHQLEKSLVENAKSCNITPEAFLDSMIDSQKKEDAEFIEQCRMCDELPLSSHVGGMEYSHPKIEFIYKTSKGVGLFFPVERVIDGIVYSYGFSLKRYGDAQIVGRYYIEQEKMIWLKNTVDRFIYRYDKCLDFIEKKELLTQELAEISIRVDEAKINFKEGLKFNLYNKGYVTERKKDKWDFYELIPGAYPQQEQIITERMFGKYHCIEIIHGATDCLFEAELKRHLSLLYVENNIKEPQTMDWGVTTVEQNNSTQLPGLTYSAIAMIAIYKNIDSRYKQEATELIKKYNPCLKNYRELSKRYKDLQDRQGILKNCDNPQTAKQRIIDIKSILEFLTADEKSEAEIDLKKIEK